MTATARILALAAAALPTFLASCGGDGADCSFSACGGDPTGAWVIKGSCIPAQTVGGGDTCPTASEVISNAITGDLSLAADMTFVSNLTGTSYIQVTAPRTCLEANMTCEQASTQQISCRTDGDNCRCTGTVDQGTTAQTGTWSVAGSSLALTQTGGGLTTWQFCAEDGGLRLHQELADPSGQTLVLEPM